MAEVTRENSAEGTAGVVSSAATNTHTGSPKRKKFIVAGTILLLAATLLAGGFLLFSKLEVGNKYALSVSDGKTTVGLTKEQYDTLYGQAKEDGYPEDQIKQAITDGLKYQIIAKSFNLEPTQAQIEAAAIATTDYSSGEQLNDWHRSYGYTAAVLGNQEVISIGGYKAALLVYQSDVPYYIEPYDEKKVQESQDYARDRAQQDYLRLTGNQTSTSDVISNIQGDSRLIGASGSNISREIVIDNGGVIHVSPDSVRESINPQMLAAIKDIGNREGFSDIRAQKNTVFGREAGLITGYYFVQIQDVIEKNENITTEVGNALKVLEVSDDIK